MDLFSLASVDLIVLSCGSGCYHKKKNVVSTETENTFTLVWGWFFSRRRVIFIYWKWRFSIQISNCSEGGYPQTFPQVSNLLHSRECSPPHPLNKKPRYDAKEECVAAPLSFIRYKTSRSPWQDWFDNPLEIWMWRPFAFNVTRKNWNTYINWL